MIETIGQWITAVIDWAGQIPQAGWAVILGVLIGGMATQWLKRTLPIKLIFPRWKKWQHVLFIRVSALLFSFIPAYAIWPHDQYRFWQALAVGVTTPSIYRVISYFAFKRWPDLEAKWSGTREGA